MNELAFRQLCRGAARCLDVDDAEALADGELVDVEGVRLRLWPDGDTARALLQLQIGGVRDEHKSDVYEALLAMQAALYPSHEAVFGFDGLDGMLSFHAVLSVSAETSDTGLAAVIRLYALQVRDWQQGLLAGCLLADVHACLPTMGKAISPVTLA